MFSISIKNVISMLFEISSTSEEKSFMEFGSGGNNMVNAMIIQVHMSMTDYSDDNENNEARDSVYVMYAGRHSIFYASAYDDNGSHRHLSNIPTSAWKNTSNHDSCWRDDGLRFLDTLYFDMANVVNHTIPPRDLYNHTSLALSLNPVTKTTVVLKALKDGYSKKITKVN